MQHKLKRFKVSHQTTQLFKSGKINKLSTTPAVPSHSYSSNGFLKYNRKKSQPSKADLESLKQLERSHKGIQERSRSSNFQNGSIRPKKSQTDLINEIGFLIKQEKRLSKLLKDQHRGARQIQREYSPSEIFLGVKNDLFLVRLEQKFEKENFSEVKYRRLSDYKTETNFITSVNFIPKVISEVKAFVHDPLKYYYLAALFTMKMLKNYLSKILQRKMKSRVGYTLTEFCQNWIYYCDSAISNNDDNPALFEIREIIEEYAFKCNLKMNTEDSQEDSTANTSDLTKMSTLKYQIPVSLNKNTLLKKGQTQLFGSIKKDFCIPPKNFKSSALSPDYMKNKPSSRHSYRNSYKVTKKSKTVEMKKAIIENNSEVIRDIMKEQKGFNRPIWGSLLLLAIEHSNTYCVKQMLRQGVDSNFSDSKANNGLHLLMKNFDEKVIQNMAILNLLIKHNTNANKFNQEGFAPLHIACCNEQYTAIESMIEVNQRSPTPVFDLSIQDKIHQNTALHIAAKLGNYKLILELGKGNPDAFVQNRYLQTPFQICKKVLVCTKLISKLERIQIKSIMFKTSPAKVNPPYLAGYSSFEREPRKKINTKDFCQELPVDIKMNFIKSPKNNKRRVNSTVTHKFGRTTAGPNKWNFAAFKKPPVTSRFSSTMSLSGINRTLIKSKFVCDSKRPKKLHVPCKTYCKAEFFVPIPEPPCEPEAPSCLN
ncbi:unnamed protein product [Moneuplotes crassus]|uniref:Uncharacterized protein n=1 Tax=Euplotes crassus TaxID=5936 RepID=A0AAD1XT05_EUPCR|nr:unnamed protein product [Moneuplotes crassus]